MEHWKPVVGHEEYLECTATGAFRKKQTKHEYKLQTHYGRLYLHVYQQGKSHCFPAYLLIARTFVPNPETKRKVQFKDGNRLNIKADNLVWADRNTANRRLEATVIFSVIEKTASNFLVTVLLNDRPFLNKTFDTKQEASVHINNLLNALRAFHRI